MKLVFVDIDGVMMPLNEESFKSFVFNPIAVAMLNCLTRETGAHIVVSSRRCMDMELDQVQQIFADNCVHGEVIGRISHPLIFSPGKLSIAEPKGLAILRWLEMGLKVVNPERFVILDDELIPEYKDHQVVVDPTIGFVSMKFYDQARAILGRRVLCSL
jgi:hypothetical protein